MKDLAHRRHGLSDRTWEILDPLLPERKGFQKQLQTSCRPLNRCFQEGKAHGEGKAKDNRLFLNAVVWIV